MTGVLYAVVLVQYLHDGYCLVVARVLFLMTFIEINRIEMNLIELKLMV